MTEYSQQELRGRILAGLPDNEARLITPAVLRSALLDMVDSSYTKAYIDPAKFGAKNDAVGFRDGVVSGGKYFQSARYHFGSDRIGQTLYCHGQTAEVVAVNNGILELSRNLSNATGRVWFIGHDNTQAIEDAMQAAYELGLGAGVGNDGGSYGPSPYGGMVRLNSGGYLVKNTQQRYDNGRIGAISIPKRCGLIGAGKGQTHIYLGTRHDGGVGNYGHGIASRETNQPGEFTEVAHFSIFGQYDFQSASCLDNIYLYFSQDGYYKTDNYSYVHDIFSETAERDNFRFTGRGEQVFFNLMGYAAQRYGMRVEGLVDSRFIVCNMGGSKKTGISIYGAANCHFTNCKSFYSGGAGGNSSIDSANWYVGADQYLNGQCIFTACESQESRGSGWLIDSGLNQFNGCLSADPGRTGLTGTGLGQPPTIQACYSLTDKASYNVFNGCYGRPALGLDYGNPNNPAMVNGTHGVYIASGAVGNKGTIWLFDNAGFSSARVAGGGTQDGNNTKLVIDGEVFASNVPSAITDLTAIGRDSSVILKWTAAQPRGAAITGVLIERFDGSNWVTVATAAGDAITYTVGGLTNDTIYPFRASSINSEGTADPSNTAEAQAGLPIEPDDLADLAAWYDASDTATITHVANAVSQIADKSGNNNHATQAAANRKPTTGSTINGLNALDFAQDALILPPALYGVPAGNNTVFMVVKPDTVVSSRTPRLLSGKASGSTTWGVLLFGTSNIRVRNCPVNDEVIYYKSLNTGVHVIGLRRTGVALQPIYDKLISGSNRATNQTVSELLFGWDAAETASQDFDGKFCEMAIYGGSKSDIEVSRLGDSLALKWGAIWG